MEVFGRQRRDYVIGQYGATTISIMIPNVMTLRTFNSAFGTQYNDAQLSDNQHKDSRTQHNDTEHIILLERSCLVDRGETMS